MIFPVWRRKISRRTKNLQEEENPSGGGKSLRIRKIPQEVENPSGVVTIWRG